MGNEKEMKKEPSPTSSKTHIQLDERIARPRSTVAAAASANQNMTTTTTSVPSNKEENAMMKKRQNVLSPSLSSAFTSVRSNKGKNAMTKKNQSVVSPSSSSAFVTFSAAKPTNTTNPQVEMLDERIARKTAQYTRRSPSPNKISDDDASADIFMPPSTPSAAPPSVPSSAQKHPSKYDHDSFRDEERKEELPQKKQSQPHQREQDSDNPLDLIYPITAIATLVPEQEQEDEDGDDNDIELGRAQNNSDNDDNHHPYEPHVKEQPVLATVLPTQYLNKNGRIQCFLCCFLFMIIIGLSVGFGVAVGGRKNNNGESNVSSNTIDSLGGGDASPAPPSATVSTETSSPPPSSSSQGENNLGEWIPNLYSTNSNESLFGRYISANFDVSMVAVSSLDSTTEEGIVKVYKAMEENEDKGWVEVGQALHDGDLPKYEYGQFVALSSSTSNDEGGTPPRLAVGERLYNKNDDGGNVKEEVGRVHTYQLSASSDKKEEWIEMGEPIVGMNEGETFGSVLSFANNGYTLAVGAPDPERTGFVRIYTWQQQEGGGKGEWKQWGDDIVGDNKGDRLGKVALSADGSIVAVGAREAKGKGLVRVYEMKTTTAQDGQTTIQEWKQMGQDLIGEQRNEKFGWSLSLSPDGTTLAVGGRRHDGGIDGTRKDSGHVKVFQYDSRRVGGGSGGGEEVYKWVPLGNDIEGEYADDKAGVSVSLSSINTELGLMLAIGAFHNDGGKNGDIVDSGQVRVYRYDDAKKMDWVQIGKDVDGMRKEDEFGKVVQISHDGKRFVASALFGHDYGGVYVFDLKIED